MDSSGINFCTWNFPEIQKSDNNISVSQEDSVEKQKSFNTISHLFSTAMQNSDVVAFSNDKQIVPNSGFQIFSDAMTSSSLKPALAIRTEKFSTFEEKSSSIPQNMGAFVCVVGSEKVSNKKVAFVSGHFNEGVTEAQIKEFARSIKNTCKGCDAIVFGSDTKNDVATAILKKFGFQVDNSKKSRPIQEAEFLRNNPGIIKVSTGSGRILRGLASQDNQKNSGVDVVEYSFSNWRKRLAARWSGRCISYEGKTWILQKSTIDYFKEQLQLSTHSTRKIIKQMHQLNEAVENLASFCSNTCCLSYKKFVQQITGKECVQNFQHPHELRHYLYGLAQDTSLSEHQKSSITRVLGLAWDKIAVRCNNYLSGKEPEANSLYYVLTGEEKQNLFNSIKIRDELNLEKNQSNSPVVKNKIDAILENFPTQEEIEELNKKIINICSRRDGVIFKSDLRFYLNGQDLPYQAMSEILQVWDEKKSPFLQLELLPTIAKKFNRTNTESAIQILTNLEHAIEILGTKEDLYDAYRQCAASLEGEELQDFRKKWTTYALSANTSKQLYIQMTGYRILQALSVSKECVDEFIENFSTIDSEDHFRKTLRTVLQEEQKYACPSLRQEITFFLENLPE